MEDKEQPKVIENLNLNLNILSIIMSYQSQNGIKNKDYERYINFIGKKINKIRRSHKMTQGKKKFTKIEINQDVVTDSKLLLIPLLEAERLWAHGSSYNHKLTSVDSIVSKWRYSAKEKFFRSTKFAEKLLNIAKSRSDELTTLEAEAYYLSILANYQMFIRKYNLALENFKKAKEIYLKLINKKDSIEGLVYKDRIKFLTMQIRFCDYNLTSTGNKTNEIFDLDEELNIEEQSQEKEDDITTKTVENYDIKYQGSTIPVKNPTLRAKLVKIDELNDKIENEPDLTKKQNLFSDLFNLIDDCIKIIKTDKLEKVNEGESLNQIFNKMINYMTFLKINQQVWKTIIYINDYKNIFTNKNFIVDILEKENTKLTVKPQDMIKLYDNLLQYFSQVRSNEREYQDDIFFNILTLKEMIATASKTFYSGFFYLTNKKFNETLSILNYFKDKHGEVVKYYEINKLNALRRKDIESLLEDLDSLVRLCEFILHKVFAKNKLERYNKKATDNKHEKAVFKCNSWLQSDIKGDKDSINHENYDIFKEYMKMSYEDYRDALKKQTYNNYTHLIQFPPNFQILTPKPISFDLVHPSIQYPDISSKCKKEEKKGILGRAFGYMFGK